MCLDRSWIGCQKLTGQPLGPESTLLEPFSTTGKFSKDEQAILC